jgi:hypothetical protein
MRTEIAAQAEPANANLPAPTIPCVVLRWYGRRVSANQFVREYASGIALFESEVSLTISRFPPHQNWRARGDLETQAAVWAVVMIVFDVVVRDHARQALLAAVLSELWSLWGQNRPRRSSEYTAVLALASGYYSLRDRGNQLITGARIVDLYLNKIGLGQPNTLTVPARYLAARFGCRILGDIYRIDAASCHGEAFAGPRTRLAAHPEMLQIAQPRRSLKG